MDDYSPETQTFNKVKNDRLKQGHRDGFEMGMQTATQRGFDDTFYHSLPILFKLNQLEGMIRTMVDGREELMLGEFKVAQLEEVGVVVANMKEKVAVKLGNSPQQQHQLQMNTNNASAFEVPEDDLCDLFKQQDLNKGANNTNDSFNTFWCNSISDLIYVYKDLAFMKHTYSLQNDQQFLHLMSELKSLILS